MFSSQGGYEDELSWHTDGRPRHMCGPLVESQFLSLSRSVSELLSGLSGL